MKIVIMTVLGCFVFVMLLWNFTENTGANCAKVASYFSHMSEVIKINDKCEVFCQCYLIFSVIDL